MNCVITQQKKQQTQHSCWDIKHLRFCFSDTILKLLCVFCGIKEDLFLSKCVNVKGQMSAFQPDSQGWYQSHFYEGMFRNHTHVNSRKNISEPPHFWSNVGISHHGGVRATFHHFHSAFFFARDRLSKVMQIQTHSKCCEHAEQPHFLPGRAALIHEAFHRDAASFLLLRNTPENRPSSDYLRLKRTNQGLAASHSKNTDCPRTTSALNTKTPSTKTELKAWICFHC